MQSPRLGRLFLSLSLCHLHLKSNLAAEEATDDELDDDDLKN